ncbi:hypothetical protein CLIB1423_33S00540 [[Candida] railenensis]|uniref:Uncharacterized protein n=1 Tax=[Candida] railenensis TaxID=45579 RepID=A0A9P0W188_9ASCO|nr:hypothetical protein CLIB1423_33S00540 [[Candida] railenensis]
MLRRAILYVAVAAIANAADTIDPLTDIASYTDAAFLISAMNEYPYLITYYSEVFGADWQKTISDALAYTGYLPDYLSYYSTYTVDTLTDLEGHTDAAYLISKVNENPDVRVFYSEAYGTDWEKTISSSYAAGFYKEYLTGYHILYNAYGTSYTDSTYDTESYLAQMGSFYETSFTDYSAYASYYRSFTSSHFIELSSWCGTDTIRYSRDIHQISRTNFGFYVGATIGPGGTNSTTTLSSSASRYESGFTTGDRENFQTTDSSQSSGSATDSSEESSPSNASSGTSTSRSSTSGNSSSSISSTAGVYSVGVPLFGLFAALIAAL